jgi:hypothetical protein
MAPPDTQKKSKKRKASTTLTSMKSKQARAGKEAATGKGDPGRESPTGRWGGGGPTDP